MAQMTNESRSFRTGPSLLAMRCHWHGGSEAFLQAREIAHRLAGTAGSYGLRDIGAALEKIDDALHEVSAEGVETARWNDIDAAVAEIREHLPPGANP